MWRIRLTATELRTKNEERRTDEGTTNDGTTNGTENDGTTNGTENDEPWTEAHEQPRTANSVDGRRLAVPFFVHLPVLPNPPREAPEASASKNSTLGAWSTMPCAKRSPALTKTACSVMLSS